MTLPAKLAARLEQHFADRRAMPQPHKPTREEWRERALWRLEAAGFTGPVLKALRGVRETPCLEAARAFIDGDRKLLVLLGSVGVGKSVAAAWACLELTARILAAEEAARSEPVCFVHATTFGRISEFDRNDREWFESLKRCRVLMLDDLGTEHLKEQGQEMFIELLELRRGRTILTSNLDKRAFVGRYGTRVAERIKEFGTAFAESGPSLRGGK